MSETVLHTEHFTANERAMSTPWHNTCTRHHPAQAAAVFPFSRFGLWDASARIDSLAGRKAGNSTLCWDSKCF